LFSLCSVAAPGTALYVPPMACPDAIDVGCLSPCGIEGPCMLWFPCACETRETRLAVGREGWCRYALQGG
jgi:hypothetical protein